MINAFEHLPNANPAETREVGALKPELNQYPHLSPYDRTLVRLSNCGYINASHMSIINGLIVAQGPRQNTVDDFWRMCSEHRIVNIVSLCTMSLTGSRPFCFDFTAGVDKRSVEIKTDAFTVSELTKDGLTYRYFHYTAWPDFGVPGDLGTLIELARHVNQYPTVVHCLAGQGRSGTFVAILALLQKADNNPLRIVTSLRNDRPNMVETVEQYEAIVKVTSLIDHQWLDQ